MSGWLRRWWPAIVAHVALVVLWQAAGVWSDVPSFVMPTPLATLRALSQPHYNWLQHTLVTAAEVFGGHALVIVIGIGMAILFSWSSVLERFLMPLIVTFNMIPKIALAPLVHRLAVVSPRSGIRSDRPRLGSFGSRRARVRLDWRTTRVRLVSPARACARYWPAEHGAVNAECKRPGVERLGCS